MTWMLLIGGGVLGGWIGWASWMIYQLHKKAKADTQTKLAASIFAWGLETYNPFSDTGGEHSFSLVLLDGKKNGIVLTSLHSRAGTRFYIKKKDDSLSKEEMQALEKALKMYES